MPRYFFSASDEEADEIGAELRDQSAARQFAIRFAGEVMDNQPDVLQGGQGFSISVTDERKVLLFTIEIAVIDAPKS
ncbi:hypothetical protein sphantq_01755 [Sphingobium sp. AntQ-1]|uniref:DUF6894 family protein n=1 Tax=Sphingobium sp. AntQ-1 TaxID=2930091 RepID=UPI00234EA7FB|nr:hypothetical protein [Sphingobium sp. AntQ-1]WCP13330.1 hypothetical protein sphantq_01755 [Sphingobium sp. AntQ-1]